MLEELTICEAGRRNLDARRLEGPDEVNRIRVPTRCEPGNVVLSAVLIDLSKVVLAQLDPVAVLHPAAGRSPRGFEILNRIFVDAVGRKTPLAISALSTGSDAEPAPFASSRRLRATKAASRDGHTNQARR